MAGAVEDAISAHQRPKIEDYDGLTFFVLKTVFFNQTESEITTGELLCFINSHFIVTVRHGEGSPLATVRHDLELKPFFRDTLDHLQVQQNIDVRKISAWVALAAGPTMIAGIYGMNFRHMPELGTKYGCK